MFVVVNVTLAGRDFMVTVICVKCKKKQEINGQELDNLIHYTKLDELARIGLTSGFLRITCKRCLKSQGK